MVQKADGMMHAPEGKAKPVVTIGGFAFAAMRLDHAQSGGRGVGLCDAVFEVARRAVRLPWPTLARDGG